MTEDEFWSLIERYVDRESSRAPVVTELENALSQRSPDQISDFAKIFERLHKNSYGWPLWGAAYIINGGCSDDGFDYFRGWLIAQGRAVYDNALRDPDSLVDVAEEDVECEDILNSASKAYEIATGLSDVPHGRQRYPDLGDDWDFEDDDEMRSRYPKLFAKFSQA